MRNTTADGTRAFTLAQVPGWEVVAAAARLVDVPLVIGAPDGTGPIPAADYRWGDPAALRASADEWTRAGREVRELSVPAGPAGGLPAAASAAAIGDGWNGLAAERYRESGRRLEASFEPVAALSLAVGARLHEIADELDRAIEQQVAAVLWTVASITAPLATWTTNSAAAPLVVNALLGLTARLERAAGAQYAAALDQRRVLAGLLDDIDGRRG
jgi:uncharacterized protein YukE